MYKKIINQGRYYTYTELKARYKERQRRSFGAEFRWIFARPQFTQITLRINENCSGGVERRMVNLQQVWLKKSCIEFHEKKKIIHQRSDDEDVSASLVLFFLVKSLRRKLNITTTT